MALIRGGMSVAMAIVISAVCTAAGAQPRPFFVRADAAAAPQVMIEQDAHLTVLGITPGAGHFAVQVLWPRFPGNDTFLRAGQPALPRPFSTGALSHRIATLSAAEPVFFLAFASNTPPVLRAFEAGKTWALDVAVNTPLEDPGTFVDVLIGILYPTPGVQFAAARLGDGALLMERTAGAQPVVPRECQLGLGDQMGGSRATSQLAAQCLRNIESPRVSLPRPDTTRRGRVPPPATDARH